MVSERDRKAGTSERDDWRAAQPMAIDMAAWHWDPRLGLCGLADRPVRSSQATRRHLCALLRRLVGSSSHGGGRADLRSSRPGDVEGSGASGGGDDQGDTGSGGLRFSRLRKWAIRGAGGDPEEIETRTAQAQARYERTTGQRTDISEWIGDALIITKQKGNS